MELVDDKWALPGDVVEVSDMGYEWLVTHTAGGTAYMRSVIGNRIVQVPNGRMRRIYRDFRNPPVDNTVDYPELLPDEVRSDKSLA